MVFLGEFGFYSGCDFVGSEGEVHLHDKPFVAALFQHSGSACVLPADGIIYHFFDHGFFASYRRVGSDNGCAK
jgi:hypothetical protein